MKDMIKIVIEVPLSYMDRLSYGDLVAIVCNGIPYEILVQKVYKQGYEVGYNKGWEDGCIIGRFTR